MGHQGQMAASPQSRAMPIGAMAGQGTGHSMGRSGGKGGAGSPQQQGMGQQVGMSRSPMKTFGMMNPGAGGHYQGGGAMVPVPGMQNQGGMGATPMNFQPIQVPTQMFQNASNMGQEQIGRTTRMGLQDIGRQFGARGLGHSGLMGLAAGGVMRGAQEQSANLGRDLQNQRLNMEFGEQQAARNLILPARQQALSEALGLGGLGIQQRQQQMAERGAYDKYRDQPSNMFGSLLQSLTAASGKSS